MDDIKGYKIERYVKEGLQGYKEENNKEKTNLLKKVVRKSPSDRSYRETIKNKKVNKVHTNINR